MKAATNIDTVLVTITQRQAHLLLQRSHPSPGNHPYNYGMLFQKCTLRNLNNYLPFEAKALTAATKKASVELKPDKGKKFVNVDALIAGLPTDKFTSRPTAHLFRRIT